MGRGFNAAELDNGMYVSCTAGLIVRARETNDHAMPRRIIITSAKEVMLSPVSVCLSVCLRVLKELVKN